MYVKLFPGQLFTVGKTVITNSPDTPELFNKVRAGRFPVPLAVKPVIVPPLFCIDQAYVVGKPVTLDVQATADVVAPEQMVC